MESTYWQRVAARRWAKAQRRSRRQVPRSRPRGPFSGQTPIRSKKDRTLAGKARIKARRS